MRRARNLTIIVLIIPLTFVLIIYNLKTVSNDDFSTVNSSDKAKVKNNFINFNNEINTRNVMEIQTQRYITPSLADLGIRGISPTINHHVLMLMKVPGAGVELLIFILQRLQGYNAFKHIRLPAGDSGLLTVLQQELLVEEITNIIRQEAIPLTFDGDVRFLNFSKFTRQSPVFISLVRHPKTFQGYRGKGATVYDGAIPYFCGHDSRCMIKNSQWALNCAKDNVQRWYKVVGILENMDETLDKLEKELPYFFSTASQVYKQLHLKMKPNKYTMRKTNLGKGKSEVDLENEIEFYNWLKMRLLNATNGND